MKKILLLVIFCIGLVSCDPALSLFDNSGFWYVKNTTSDTFSIHASAGNNTSILSPNDSICIYNIAIGIRNVNRNYLPTFNIITNNDNNVGRRQITVHVYSKEGKLLQTWDNKDEQSLKSDFFNESKWRVHRKDNANKSVEISWTYDITDNLLKQ